MSENETLASGAPRSAIARLVEELPKYRLVDRVSSKRQDLWVDLLDGTEVYLAADVDAALRVCAEAPETENALTIPATDDEREQVELAAQLRHQTVEEYIARAINAAMRKQGVDAVLFRESDDE